MDWEVILKGLGLIFIGLLFVRFGLGGWRHRREDQVSLIEAAILRAGKQENPLPLNQWDRTMESVQPVLMLILGPLLILCGVAVLSLLGE